MVDCRPTYVPPENRAPSLTPTQRFRILERDGHTCRYCGASAPDVELQVDHIKPRSAGGSNKDDNLVTACRTCNIGKSDKPWSDWKSVALRAIVEKVAVEDEFAGVRERGRAMTMAHRWKQSEWETAEQLAGASTPGVFLEAWRYPWHHGHYIDMRLRNADVVTGVGVVITDDGVVHIEVIGGTDVHVCREGLTGAVNEEGLSVFETTSQITLADCRPKGALPQ